MPGHPTSPTNLLSVSPKGNLAPSPQGLASCLALEHSSVFVLISDKHAFALQSCIMHSASAWESAAVICLRVLFMVPNSFEKEKLSF